jgi:hypothetical protein
VEKLIFIVRGEWESGRVGEWESGRVGEWESGRVGRIFPFPFSLSPLKLSSLKPNLMIKWTEGLAIKVEGEFRVGENFSSW